jgi:monothiol glutaredoxin
VILSSGFIAGSGLTKVRCSIQAGPRPVQRGTAGAYTRAPQRISGLPEGTVDPLERIKKQVTDNPVILYMKGTPDFPQCGFSARTVQALKDCGVEFAFVNIFEDQEVYKALPKYANWPTFPQLYVKGELIGGCDITLDLHQSGELQKMLKEAVAEKA